VSEEELETSESGSTPIYRGWKMKATISVVLNDGTVVEGDVELHPRQDKKPKIAGLLPSPAADKRGDSPSLDFDLEARPFMKRYGMDLSGPERLILLVAHFAKGVMNVPVPRTDVVHQWGKMKALMGGNYNGAYDTRARDTGWLHSPKAGVFELRGGWDKIFKKSN
jgi:hypothetical protein